MKHWHSYCRHARHLVAEVDDGHGHELPSDSPVPQELQRAFWWGCLNGCLLSRHFIHLLFVVALTPQSLESWDVKEQRETQRAKNKTESIKLTHKVC